MDSLSDGEMPDFDWFTEVNFKCKERKATSKNRKPQAPELAIRSFNIWALSNFPKRVRGNFSAK